MSSTTETKKEVKCKGLNRKKAPCGNNPLPGSSYCKAHQNQDPKKKRKSNAVSKGNNLSKLSENNRRPTTDGFKISILVGLCLLFLGLWINEIRTNSKLENKLQTFKRDVEKANRDIIRLESENSKLKEALPHLSRFFGGGASRQDFIGASPGHFEYKAYLAAHLAFEIRGELVSLCGFSGPMSP